MGHFSAHTLIYICVMLSTVFNCVDCQACPTSWKAYNGFCYNVDNTAGDYDAAVAACAGKGATLTSILSDAEQAFIVQEAASMLLWIGLNDKTTNDMFVWEDGSIYNAANAKWTTGGTFPTASMNCAHLSATGTWEDVACVTSLAGFICKGKGAEFGIDDATFVGKEGGSVMVTINRDGILDRAYDLTLTAAGGAISPATYGTANDYYGPSQPAMAETVSFAAYDTTKTVVYTINDDPLIEGIETFTLTLAVTGATGMKTIAAVRSPSSATVFIVDCTSTIEFAEERYIVEEGKPLNVLLIRRGPGLPTTANRNANVELDTNPNPAADLTLPSGTTVVFADNSVLKNTLMVMTTADALVEDMECFGISLLAVGIMTNPTNAAGAIGSISTTQICIIDATSTIEFAEERYVVEEGKPLNVLLIRRGPGLPTTANLNANVELDTNPNPAADLTLPSGTTVVFADNSVLKNTLMVMTTADALVEDMECFGISLIAVGIMTNPTNAAGAIGSISTTQICIIDATSTIEFAEDRYVIEEGNPLNVLLIRRGPSLPTTANLNANVELDTNPNPAADLTLPSGTTVVFADNSVLKNTLMVMTTADALVEDMECFGISLIAVGIMTNPTNAAGAIGSISTTQICIIDATSTIEFAEERYVVEEGNPLNVLLIRRGPSLPTTANLNANVELDTNPNPAADLTLPSGTTVVFADSLVLKNTLMVMTTTDALVEDMECFGISLIAVGIMTNPTNAAGAIGSISTTQICIIDATSTIEFAEERYVVEEGNPLNVLLIRHGPSIPTTANLNANVELHTNPNPAADLTLPSGTTVVFADNSVLTNTLMVMTTADALVEDMECFGISLIAVGIMTNPTNAAGAIGSISTTQICIIDATSTIEFAEERYVVEEGNPLNVLLIRRGPSLPTTANLNANVELDTNPNPAADLTLPSGTTVVFSDNSILTNTLMVMTTPDAVVEDMECFGISLIAVGIMTNPTNAAGAIGSISTTQICIIDATSLFWIEDKQCIAFEETTLEVTFHRGGYLGRTDIIMVAYTNDRATTADYTAGAATIMFTPGEITKTAMVPITADNVLEYCETFDVGISLDMALAMVATVYSPSNLQVIIKDPTWYVFDRADYTVVESTGMVTITILRKGDISTAGFIYIQTDDTSTLLTARANVDYTSLVNMKVTFNSMDDMKTVNILIDATDTVYESDEQFAVGLINPDTAEALGDINKAVVTIFDDDNEALTAYYRFQKVVYHVTESSASVTITLLRNGALTANVAGSVDISTMDRNQNRYLTAEVGTDFIGLQSQTINFPTNDNIEDYTIRLADNVDVEKMEYFEVCMSNPTFGLIDAAECAIVYIDNDDSFYGFDKPVYYVKEGASTTVNIVRLGCSKTQGSVELSTSDVTALQTADYVPITSRLIPFGVGVSNVESTINSAALDLRVEGEERFEVCLANPMQGALGLNGLIRCTTIVVQDCDSEIIFGDASYTVNEGTATISIEVVRRGYVGSIASVDIVSSEVTAKEGPSKDYMPISHTVIFGASDSPQETMVSFDITVSNDEIVEPTEFFNLNLANVNGALIGKPSVAEVLIADNDVAYRLNYDAYTVSERDKQATLTVLRDGYLDQQTHVGIFTRDISASSSAPNQDYEPLLEALSVKVVFEPNERSKTVMITLIDDAVFESAEKFRVILNSDIADHLHFPSEAVVTIQSDDIECALNCQNGGFCTSPTECQCAEGYKGTLCEEDINECVIQPPVCVGNQNMCFNRVGTYECICTDPAYYLQGNTCIQETREIIGRIYADELNDQPIQFEQGMYDSMSGIFMMYADLIEPQLQSSVGGLQGFQDASVLRLFPTTNGIGAVFGVTVASSSPADEADVNTLIASTVTPSGNLGTSTLSIVGDLAQLTRTIDGVFYASSLSLAQFQSSANLAFNPDLLDTNSPAFKAFAASVEPELAELFKDLAGFRGVRVKRVFPVGDSLGVDYDVTVQHSSPVTVDDLNDKFAAETGLEGFLGNSGVLLMPSPEICPSTYCQNGGVCRVLTDLSNTCICDPGFIGTRCQTVNDANATAAPDTGTGSGDNTSLSNGAIIGIGIGGTALILATFLGFLLTYYTRVLRRAPKQLSLSQAPVGDDQRLQLAGPLGRYNNSSQISPAFPSLMKMPPADYKNGAYQYYR